MRAALAQLNLRVGDLNGNTKKALDAVAAAKAAGAALVVLPELAVTGYPPRDILDYRAFVDANLAALQTVARAASGITVVCGYVEKNRAATGRPWHNAAAVLAGGKVQGTYRKQLLPYYDVFDEERYFEPGADGENCLFDVGGEKVAVTICEDLWNAAPYLLRPYERKPLEALRREKPGLVVNLSASPFNVGKPALREKLFGETARALKAPVLFCNQAGANDDLIFDGCSLALAADGKVVARGPAFAEALVVVDTAAVKAAPAPDWPDSEAAWIRAALELGIRDYVAKAGGARVCLGLSGGVDSSVVAALAVGALGAANVTALALPSRFTASASNEDAAALAGRLGIALKTLPIEPPFSAIREEWKKALGHDLAGVSLENLQPRLRMALLMAYANETGAFLLNTSNKSEIATGFATLYGDSAGALSVIGDLTKGRVYALAAHLNRDRELIPRRVLERAPSAELRENQTDQDTLPPYDTLDALVTGTIEGLQSPDELVRAGHPAEAVRKFGRMFGTSEYKRRQLPPVLRVTPRAFGVGRRIPVAAAKPWEG